MKLTAYIIQALCLTAAISAPAQTLSTEVVVDRTVEPAQRAANRPEALYPRLVLPAVGYPSLSTAGYTGYGEVSRIYSPLDPAAEPGLEPLSPYRGYASIGYFPTYNLGISAGYRILHTSRTRLGVWGQFDGESFKAPHDGSRQAFNGGRLGVDLNQTFGQKSHLLVGLSGGYSSYKSLYYDTQSLGEGRISAAWLSSARRIHYKVAAKASFDSYGDYAAVAAPDRKSQGISQQLFGFEAAGAYSFSDSSRAGLDIEGSWLATSQGAPTLGAIGVTPFYSWQSNSFTARLGAKFDFTTGGDSGVNVAPEVTLAWAPSGTFAIYGTATGGSRLNPVSSLRQYTPYIVGREALDRSDIPVDARIGLNFGPFKGFTAEVFGAYAVANDWIMPDGAAFRQLSAGDVKALRGGVRLSYAYRSLFKVSAAAEFAQSSDSKAWYQWRDRADKVITADAEITPLPRLKITAGYEFRGGRHLPGPAGSPDGLGCVSDLRAGASYGITDAFGVYARIENILSRRHSLLPGVTNQAIHGLIGIDYKF